MSEHAGLEGSLEIWCFSFLKQEKMCDGPDPREIHTFIVQSTEKEKKKGVDFGEKSLKTSLKSCGELGAQTQAS